MSAAPTELARPSTFEWLVETYHAPVFRFLYRLSGGRREDAEDVCQEAFLRAFRAFGSLGAGAQHRAWIYKIAYNAFLNHRRGARATAELVDEVAETPVDHDGRELVREIAAFVRTLPPKQRAALVLRRVEEREYAEIARVLGCSEEAARASVSEAVKKVRERFREEYS